MSAIRVAVVGESRPDGAVESLAALPGVELTRVVARGSELGALLRGVDCVLTDGDGEEALPALRRAAAVEPALQRVVVVSAERRAQLQRQILFTPTLGEVWLLTPEELGLPVLEQARSVTGSRRRYRSTQRRIRQDLTTLEPRVPAYRILPTAYLAALLQAVPDPVISLASDGSVLTWSQGAEEILGVPAADAVGRPLVDVANLVPPASEIPQLGPGETFRRPITFTRAGGDTGAGELIVFAVAGEAEVIRAVILHDLTRERAAQSALEEKAAELEEQGEETRALNRQLEEANHRLGSALETAEAAQADAQRQEEQFRSLANSIPQLAWMACPDGSIFWYNDRWYDYTGTTPEEMLGWGWKKVHHPAEVDRVTERFVAAVQAGTSWEDTFPLRSAAGEYRAFLSRALPIRDEGGEIVRWFGTNTDVEELRIAERERDQALAEAQTSRAVADAAREEAERANRAKSLFLANMSHEIRTPINAIVGYTDLIELGLGGSVSEKQQSYVTKIKGSSEHLLGLVNDILDLSKVEAGELTVKLAAHPLRHGARMAMSMVAPLALKQGVELTDALECDPDVRYRGDEDRVRQILINLLSNAVKFTEPGGHVVLRCRLDGAGPGGDVQTPTGWLAVDVQDTGVGIAEEELERIFDPFVQVEEGHTRKRGGTGLGLTISRRLARLMGGDLGVESRLGEGSRFTLWLPRAEDAAEGG